MADDHVAPSRASTLDDEHAPRAVAALKRRARRYGKHVATFPEDDAHLDPKAIAQHRHRLGEVHDDVDTLLVHA